MFWGLGFLHVFLCSSTNWAFSLCSPPSPLLSVQLQIEPTTRQREEPARSKWPREAGAGRAALTGSLSQCPSALSSTQGRFPFHWPGCQIHLCGLSNWHGTLNPHAWCFLNSVSRRVKEIGVKPPFPGDTLPHGKGAHLAPARLPRDHVLLPAPSISASLPLHLDSWAASAPPPRQPCKDCSTAARLVGQWVGFSLPLSFLTDPVSQIRNTPSSPLSKSPGAFQTLQTKRPGGWAGIISPFLQAPSPGTETGGWMFLHVPFAPHGWPGRGEDRLASG